MTTALSRSLALIAAAVVLAALPAQAQVLDGRKLVEAETFWDNRDTDWFLARIPLFECPDRDLQTTYYYRWELITKHLTYGSPNTGYSFTEFIDRPFWSGAYGAISCPAGHQLYEVRWLRDPRYARDYARYWLRTPGAQPRNYSTWLADATWAVHRVHPDAAFLKDLLPDLVKNYQGWEARHWVPQVGLFWQTGHDDGMEFNINSRQTRDILRGAPAYRPTINAYMYADALAIAKIADLAGDRAAADRFRARAAGVKDTLQKKLWDPQRRFFFPMARQDEEREGHTVKALSLTYQTGQFAGDPHGRELIGFVPWQFNLPDSGCEDAWKPLMSRDGFFADFGPTTVERHDPLFKISKTCCWWSGNSWPYATTQTLKALANLLQGYDQKVVSRDDYLKLLTVYAKTHRKNGRPYLAEACHPDTGSWEGHDGYNHSEHYFHSGYCDLIVTGLVGLLPGDDDTVKLHPLAPESWDYFALDQVPCRGHLLTVLWDRTGDRYKKGRGLTVLAGGRKVASSEKLAPLTFPLPAAPVPASPTREVNYAVNNDGGYYPRLSVSHANPRTPAGKLIDGNAWYTPTPPNRWTCEGSTAASDWCAVDFGTPRQIHTVKLYVLDDGKGVTAPARIDLETWDGKAWQLVPDVTRTPEVPTGQRANVFCYPARDVTRLRAVLHHGPGGKSGLSEFEAWGDASGPVVPAPPPAGNLAYNPGDRPFPKATASFTSPFDRVEKAIDGITIFTPTPNNRWTSYESKNETDWLQIDFGGPRTVARVDLALFDDGGGVQAPADYRVQTWDGQGWQDVKDARRSPEKPTGGQYNEVRFAPVPAAKVRIVFTHKGRARSGVSEVMIWPD